MREVVFGANPKYTFWAKTSASLFFILDAIGK
jgi:hypothetical protein